MESGFLHETKTILKSLVISCPNGMTVDRLNRDYRETVGEWIPFKKLGYQSLELFLKSVPDTLVLTGHGREAIVGFVSSDRTQHINELINRQKNTTRDRKAAMRTEPQRNSRPIYVPPKQANVNQAFPNIYCTYNPNVIRRNAQGYSPAHHFQTKPTNFIHEKSISQSNRTTTTANYKNLEQYDQKTKSKTFLNETDENKTTLTNKFDKQNTINKSNEINKSKVSIDQKNPRRTLYEPRTVKSQPESSCQNKSNTPINVQMPENKNSTSSNSIKFPTAQVKFSSKKKFCEKIIKRPELPTLLEIQYAMQSKHNLNEPDAIPIRSRAPPDADNFDVSRYLTDPFSTLDSSDNDEDEAIPEFAADYRVFHVDFPENTVPFGTKIPSVQLPKDFTKGAVVGVFISEIHSPFKFWFHLHKENHELDILMRGIESFYECLDEADLLIPRSCITQGQICVALYNGMWHRAEILSAVIKSKVKVLFVDYGTVSEVDICNVKYLQNRFAETPVQAIRGCLSHIKPVSQVWQKRAIKEFLSLVAEIFLYAQIVEIDEKEKIIYMVLCDTNSGETLQINKLLVDRGFARLDSEWDENKIKQNGYRKRHPRDIFPTFEMLETGEYPSLCELEQLLAQGVDYEKITEKIMLSSFSNNNMSVKVPVYQGYPSLEKMSFNLLDTNPFKSDIISEIVSLKMFDK